MSSVDITQQTNLISTPQDEAAQNIQHAKVFDISPDDYKAGKEQYDPTVKTLQQPALASPVVADTIKQSEQHAAAIAPDSGTFSKIEGWFSDIGNRFQNKIGPEQKLNDLAWKKLTSDPTDPKNTFTDDDALNLRILQMDQGQNFGKPISNLGFVTGTVTDLAGDMTAMVRKNAPTIAAATALGAGVTGTEGLLAGGPIGAAVGAAVGAGQGALAGFAAAGVDDGYHKAAAQAYLALDSMKNVEGVPMDEKTKRALAHGVGIVTGGVQIGTDFLMASKLPYLKTFMTNPEAVSGLMAPANKGIRDALIKLGSVAMTGGVGGGAQALANITAKGIGETYQGGQVQFMNGIMNTVKNVYGNTNGELGELASGVGGGAFGGLALGLAHEGVSHGLQKGGSASVQVAGKAATGLRTTLEKVTNILNVQDTLNASSEVAKETALHKISPVLSNEVRQKIAESSGIDKLYIDRESLEKFVGDNEEKRAAVHKALGDDSNFTDATKINAPGKMPIAAVMDLHDQFPDFSDHVKLDPSGPNPTEAKAFVERMQTAEAQRKDVAQRLGVLDETPAERAQKVQVVADTTNEDLAKMIGTKEVGQAYLDRLDKNAAHVRNQDDEAIPQDYNFVPMDTTQPTEGKTMYHGTKANFSKLSEANVYDHSNVGNLYGEGLYLTDNPNIAESYAKNKGEGKNGRVLAARLKNLNLIDLSKPLPPEVHKIYQSYIDRHDGGKVSINASGEEVFKELKNAMAEAGTYSADAMDVYAGINSELSSAGYDGLRHRGGGRVKGSANLGDHNVTILFEDSGKLPDGTTVGRQLKNKFDDVAYNPATKNSQQLENISRVRNRVEAMMEHLPADEAHRETLRRALPADEPSHDVFGEHDFMAQTDTQKAMLQDIFPAGELERHTERVAKAKQTIVDGINDQAEFEQGKVADINEFYERDARATELRQQIENDPKIKIVDAYHAGSDGIVAHGKKTFSIFAIDPKFLTDEQRNAYLDDAALKENKVFTKGGTSPDDAALLLGVKDGETLLKILRETPTSKRLINTLLEQQQAEIRQAAVDASGINHVAIENAYHDETRNNLEVMARMVDKSQTSTLKSVARIAGEIPRVEELNVQAKTAIGKTTVGDLDAQAFKVGARKSQRIATDHYIKGDFVNAADNMQKAALNNELQIEAMKAARDVRKAMQTAKQFRDPEVQQELKDAGRSFEKAASEILDVFNLDPAKKNQSILGSYQKFVKNMYEAGRGNFQINPELSDVRQSFKDMTVDQVKAVGARLEMILHSARTENIMSDYRGEVEAGMQTHEAVVAKLGEHLENLPRYDEKRAQTVVKDQTDTQKRGSWLVATYNSIRNMEHILLDLDNGQHGGPMSEAIMARIKGDGKYSEYGQSNLNKRQAASDKVFEQIIEDTIGKKELSLMKNTPVDVPEFAGNTKISNKLNKAQLFMMKLNTGNEGNWDRLVKGFDTDKETIQKVLDRELTVAHSEMAQKIFDHFEDHFTDVRRLKVKMEGVDPEMVQASGMKHGDKEFRGGYYPIRYDSEPSLLDVARKSKGLQARVDGSATPKITDSYDADGMTAHGHDMARQGSDGRPVNLDMDTIGQNLFRIQHDLAYRLPLSDVMKILTDPRVAKGIAANEGLQALNQMHGSVVDLASPATEQNALTASTNVLNRLTEGFLSTAKTATLAYKPVIMLKHLSNGIFAMKAMGVEGTKMVGHTAMQMVTHPELIKGFYEMAGDINPAIRDHANGIDGSARDLISQQMPVRDRFSVKQPIRQMAEVVNSTASAIIGHIDTFNKVIYTNAAYASFKAGHVDGFSLEKLKTMSADEIDHQAKVYATNVVRTTLPSNFRIDAAPIQHDPKWKAFTTFIGPVRNTIANIAREGRVTGDLGGATVRAAVAGDGAAFRGNATDTANHVIKAVLGLTAAKLIGDSISGKSTPFTQEDDTKPMDWATYALLAGPKMFVEHMPFLSALDYAYEQKQWAKEHNRPTDVKITTYGTKIGVDLLNTVDGFMDLYNGNDIDKKQRNSIIATGTYAAGVPLPVDTMMRAYDAIKDSDTDILKTPLVTAVQDRLGKFLHAQEDVPPAKQLDDETKKALQDIRDQLQKSTAGANDSAMNDVQIPDGVVNKIKTIESNGNAFAQNPKSSAAGLYQFTDKTWKEIKSSAPELGLTTGGRLQANGVQQEKAMEWFTKSNISKLQAANVAVTEDNIYAAHFLGAEKAIEVLQAPATTKLKTLVGDNVMASNDFRSGMKVRDFKGWLSQKLKSAGSDQVAMLDNKK